MWCTLKIYITLQRTFTSLYTTAESSNAMDLICQICLGPFRDCVALQPCGHSFCAPCLSHHFAAILQVSIHARLTSHLYNASFLYMQFAGS